MKTIAIFSGYYLPHLGGVERYTYNLAKKLHDMGNKVIIITSQYDKNLKEIEETDEAKIYRLPTYKLFSGRYPINKVNRKYKKIMKMLECEHIDTAIIQTRFWITSYLAAKFTYKNNIPACIIDHGSSHFTVNNKVLDKLGEVYEHLLTNSVKKKVKDYYGVSEKCVEWLKHFDIDAKGVFYNSVDVSEVEKYKDYLDKSDDKIVISYVGRMIEEKGVLKLIDAFKVLQKKYDNLELNLAGSGPILDRIINENQHNEGIKVLGRLSHEDVLKLLGRTSIFVNPSAFSEGLPTSILEAGMMRCAVVATPMGGTAEIISSDDIGCICGFEMSDILEKLEMLIASNDEIHRLGENIFSEVVNRFSWDVTAKKIFETVNYRV